MNLKLITAAIALSAFTAQAGAVMVYDNGGDGNGTGLQSQLDLITTGGTSGIDVNADQMDDGLDSYWNITGSGGSVTTFVVEISGNEASNSFGIFDRADHTNYVELFNGSDTPDNGFASQITLSILANGDVGINGVGTGKTLAGKQFGYYLGNANGPKFYSDSTLNTNGSDQMVALAGNNTDEITIPGYNAGIWTDNEFMLAWEDVLYANSDKDFNDLVVMVESVLPVPEPGTLALLGLGLAGLGAARRRQKA